MLLLDVRNYPIVEYNLQMIVYVNKLAAEIDSAFLRSHYRYHLLGPTMRLLFFADIYNLACVTRNKAATIKLFSFSIFDDRDLNNRPGLIRLPPYLTHEQVSTWLLDLTG